MREEREKYKEKEKEICTVVVQVDHMEASSFYRLRINIGMLISFLLFHLINLPSRMLGFVFAK